MKLLAYFRLILFAIAMILYIGTILIISLFVGDKHKASMPLRKPIIIIFFSILGVKIHRSGVVPKGTALFIGNHISYLDPFVVVYHTIAHPVAKMEVSKWPLIGKTVGLSGVIFVKRGNASSLRATRGEIAQALMDEKSVLVYPEGTTSDGSSTLSFRGGVFDIAHKHDFPVIPITVAYKNSRAAYIGTSQFLPHFITMFSFWRNEVFIHFGEPIKSTSGKELLIETKTAIDNQLALFNETIAGYN